MRKVITKVFKYDELTDEAKEKALNWYVPIAYEYGWWEGILDDAGQIGLKIKGFDIDGSSIDASLMLSPLTVCKKILANHGSSCDTFSLAFRWFPTFQNVDDEGEPTYTEENIKDFLYELKEEYLSLLRAEQEFMTSKEAMEESIRANEYEFTEHGEKYIP
jgi:hypothetical protein